MNQKSGSAVVMMFNFTQVIKRAQRQEGATSREYLTVVEEEAKQNIRAAYNNFRTKLMMETPGGNSSYSAREHYLNQDPRDVVVDVLNKYQAFVDCVRDLGCHNLDAESKALGRVKNDLGKSKLAKELFKFAVIVSNSQAKETVDGFLEKLRGDREQKAAAKPQLKKIPRGTV